MSNKLVVQIGRIILRLFLSAAFLSAIADRFGVYGPHGAAGVSWGDWSNFLEFVGVLIKIAPHAFLPAIGVIETIIEIALGIALLLGVYPRIVAWLSAALLASFAVSMSIALGIPTTLGYGVFTAVGAALLLGAVEKPGSTWDPLSKNTSEG
jgi:putative oxidoreductase